MPVDRGLKPDETPRVLLERPGDCVERDRALDLAPLADLDLDVEGCAEGSGLGNRDGGEDKVLGGVLEVVDLDVPGVPTEREKGEGGSGEPKGARRMRRGR